MLRWPHAMMSAGRRQLTCLQASRQGSAGPPDHLHAWYPAAHAGVIWDGNAGAGILDLEAGNGEGDG